MTFCYLSVFIGGLTRLPWPVTWSHSVVLRDSSCSNSSSATENLPDLGIIKGPQWALVSHLRWGMPTACLSEQSEVQQESAQTPVRALTIVWAERGGQWLNAPVGRVLLPALYRLCQTGYQRPWTGPSGRTSVFKNASCLEKQQQQKAMYLLLYAVYNAWMRQSEDNFAECVLSRHSSVASRPEHGSPGLCGQHH